MSSKKLYVVNYSTSVKRGGRSNFSKVVETNDIESFIKSKFVIGFTLVPGEKSFHDAIEVKKANGGKYEFVYNGTYWYAKRLTPVDYVLKSSIQKTIAHFDEYMNLFYCPLND